MNGFTDHGDLQEVYFEEPKGLTMKTFDAFRKLAPSRNCEPERY
jgi:hypothetical protein